MLVESNVAEILLVLAGKSPLNMTNKNNNSSSNSILDHFNDDDTLIINDPLSVASSSHELCERIKMHVSKELSDDEDLDLDFDHALMTKDRSSCTPSDLDRIRRERNRKHAKKTRMRKKKMLQELETLVNYLETEVSTLHYQVIEHRGEYTSDLNRIDMGLNQDGIKDMGSIAGLGSLLSMNSDQKGFGASLSSAFNGVSSPNYDTVTSNTTNVSSSSSSSSNNSSSSTSLGIKTEDYIPRRTTRSTRNNNHYVENSYNGDVSIDGSNDDYQNSFNRTTRTRSKRSVSSIYSRDTDDDRRHKGGGIVNNNNSSRGDIDGLQLIDDNDNDSGGGMSIREGTEIPIPTTSSLMNNKTNLNTDNDTQRLKLNKFMEASDAKYVNNNKDKIDNASMSSNNSSNNINRVSSAGSVSSGDDINGE